MQWRTMGWWLTAIAAAATLLGFWVAGGRPWLRHFAFPVLFFFTAVPIFRGIEEPGMSWLMQHNARLAAEALSWFGIEAQARGNLIVLAAGTLGVDEACSGLRSLQGTLMLALFLGELLGLSWRRRAVLLAAGFGWALAANVARTAALGWIAERRGIGAVEVWHDPAGYTVLGICSALVALTAWLLYPGSYVLAANLTLASASIDARRIVRGFREIARPSLAAIVALVIGLVGTEAWFGIHEKFDVPLPGWRFRLPSELATFKNTEISPRIRANLAFDQGGGGIWRDASGFRWQALYFRWLPKRNLARTVAVHDPRICLSGAGMKAVATLPEWDFTKGDIALPIDAFHFLDGTTDVFVFNSVVNDFRRPQAGLRDHETNSLPARIAAALAGKRHRGQRRIEVAVWGAPNAATATEAFQRLLESQIQIEETTR